MTEKKWVIEPIKTAEERGELLGLIRKGEAAARRLTRAWFALADQGGRDGPGCQAHPRATDNQVALHQRRGLRQARPPLLIYDEAKGSIDNAAA